MNKSTILVVIGLFLLSCNQKGTSNKEPEKEISAVADSLTLALQKIQKEGQINGFGVAIVDKDTVLYENGIGYADLDNEVAYTQNTLQNIASISKTFIGIALLKAQEMGKLKLDDPIQKHLPFTVENPFFPEKPITIRHLATHTSTIVDTDVYDEESYILKTERDSVNAKSIEIPENFNAPEKKTSMSDFLQSVLSENGKWYSKEGFLDKKPGELFEYTNVGATLAALIIENATGEKFNEFTTKYILKPLEMNASGWSFDAIDVSMHSKLYKTPTTELPLYSLITYPDGGFITSSHDMNTYLIELINGYSENGTVLTNESYKELFTKQLDANHFTERNEENPYNDEYNSGIFMGFSAKGYVGHTGGDPGVSTFMFFDSKKKIGRVLLINTDLNNKEGVEQFFSIWDTLEEYQEKLN
ncbi:serine hydrolase domain-containing protein [Aquimarina celericrescens]|uniref:Serine hydrolase domain-containing protein n=1 Tax=Aquimarina celericrescens TaxID=1964542 RepID=A0ABW5AVE5_9FLAO|nr:beta-lactamase family protein [Aquimarina celericrescens]